MSDRAEARSDSATTTTTATASPPSVAFESITFSDGTTVQLDSTDIVVFVGPNNAGKSAALRELENHIGPPIRQTVTKAVQLKRTGTVEQLRAFLEATSYKRGKIGSLQYQGYGYNLSVDHLEAFWKDRVDLFRALLCKRIATEARITNSNPKPAIVVLEDVPSHPIHMLYLDDRIEARLSKYFARAFGQELIVFRGGGGQIPLMVGTRPELETGEDRVSATYLRRLKAQAKPLDGEGDGMRSFAQRHPRPSRTNYPVSAYA